MLGLRTNRSAALLIKGVEVVLAPFPRDMSVGDCVRLLKLDVSRKGFRDTGRGGGLESRGGRLPKRVGEAARLRNGLLEDKFNVRTGAWEPIEKCGQRSAPCMRQYKQVYIF
jgi:hypothetical protein